MLESCTPGHTPDQLDRISRGGPGIGLCKAAQVLLMGSQARGPLLWFSRKVPLGERSWFLSKTWMLLTFHFSFCGTNLGAVLKRIQGKWLLRAYWLFINLIFSLTWGEIPSTGTTRWFCLPSVGPVSSIVIVQIVIMQPVQQCRGGCLSDVPGSHVLSLWEWGKWWMARAL